MQRVIRFSYVVIVASGDDPKYHHDYICGIKALPGLQFTSCECLTLQEGSDIWAPFAIVTGSPYGDIVSFASLGKENEVRILGSPSGLSSGKCVGVSARGTLETLSCGDMNTQSSWLSVDTAGVLQLTTQVSELVYNVVCADSDLLFTHETCEAQRQDQTTRFVVMTEAQFQHLTDEFPGPPNCGIDSPRAGLELV